MRPSSLHTLIAAVVCLTICGVAHATSGWDRHQVDVEMQYRIQGVHGRSLVHRLDSTGSPVDPPLIEERSGPPDYAVTETYLLIRYMGWQNPDVTPGCCYAIRRDDHRVIGPISYDELQRLEGADPASARWKTPRTPSVWGFLLAVALLNQSHCR